MKVLLTLPYYSGDEFIEQSLYEYYSSFQPYKVTGRLIRKHYDVAPDLKKSIVSKYLGLEKSSQK